MLKNQQMTNPRTGDWLGLFGVKRKFLQSKARERELAVVDVDKYKAKTPEEQLAFLYNLTRFRENGEPIKMSQEGQVLEE